MTLDLPSRHEEDENALVVIAHGSSVQVMLNKASRPVPLPHQKRLQNLVCSCTSGMREILDSFCDSFVLGLSCLDFHLTSPPPLPFTMHEKQGTHGDDQ
jgi:hypothetical protein